MDKKFTVLVEKGESGYLIASVPELPGCYSQAKSLPELKQNIKEAIELHLETLNLMNKNKDHLIIKMENILMRT